MIAGVATILVDVQPFREKLDNAATKATLSATYSQEEIDYCAAHRDGAPHLAVRHAARLAFCRAAGIEPSPAVFRQIVIERAESGAPSFRLAPELADELARRGIHRRHLSMSHTRAQAVAMVVLETEAAQGEKED